MPGMEYVLGETAPVPPTMLIWAHSIYKPVLARCKRGEGGRRKGTYIKLSTTGRTSTVESNHLGAEEVLARGDARGDVTSTDISHESSYNREKKKKKKGRKQTYNATQHY